MKGKIVTVSERGLFFAAYLYMAIPIIIFFLGYLRLPFGILFSGLLMTGILWHFKKEGADIKPKQIEIPLSSIILMSVLIMLWIYLVGIGGFTYQRADHHWRNAVLRDLIEFSWPVVYPLTGNSLVYYLNYWMVPAVFGKLFGYTAANVVLYLWSVIGVFIALLLIMNLLKIRSFYKCLGLCLAFFLFGYLSDVREFVRSIFAGTRYADFLNYRFSKHTELVAWVYNQSIVPFVAVPLFLNEKEKLSSLALLGLCVLPFAPFPFVGMFFILAGYGLYQFARSIKGGVANQFCKEVFSVPNICALLSIFVVFAFYFSCNTSANGSVGGGVNLNAPLAAIKQKPFIFVFWLLVFYASNFGIIMVLLFKENKKNPLFYITLASLMLIPFVRIGFSGDFCWRASIPAQLLIFIMAMESLLGKNGASTMRRYLLVICLALPAWGEAGNFSDTLHRILPRKLKPLTADSFYTFSDKGFEEVWDNKNFLDTNPEEQFFFKVLAKQKTEKQSLKDIATTRRMQEKRGVCLAEGKYSISPVTEKSLFITASDSTKIPKYAGKDMIFAEEKIPVRLALVTFSWGYSGVKDSDINKYKIYVNNLEFDVPWGNPNMHGGIALYPPNNSDAQKFRILESDGHYKILWNDYALTFMPETKSVCLAPDKNLPTQHWSIEKYSD